MCTDLHLMSLLPLMHKHAFVVLTATRVVPPAPEEEVKPDESCSTSTEHRHQGVGMFEYVQITGPRFWEVQQALLGGAERTSLS